MLAFKCGYLHPKEWKDGKLKIEERLAEILAYLELKAEKKNKERIEREEFWAKRDEEERLKKELQERKEKEYSDFKNLIKLSARWRETKDLREYISAFEQVALNRGVNVQEVAKWTDWAHKKANWYDPFIETEDELLGKYSEL